MDNKPYSFLGQYLVGNGAITEQQLEEGIRRQKENNALIGTIALAQGLLDAAQINHLIKRQAKVDERIGRLAVEEGYLTEDELNTVLSIQGRNHVYLGESLVRLGLISQAELDEALSDFEHQIVSLERRVREEVGRLSIANEALVTLDVLLRFFYRLGYPVRVVGSGLPDAFEHVYCSEQKFKKVGTGYMGLGMGSMLADCIVHGPAIRERTGRDDPDAMEGMSQLVFNLNYQVCRRMKQSGIRVKHGDAYIAAPGGDHPSGVCLDLETVTSRMVFTYGVRRYSERPVPYHSGLVRMAL